MQAFAWVAGTLEGSFLAALVVVTLGLIEFARRYRQCQDTTQQHREMMFLAREAAIAEAMKHGRRPPHLDRAA